MRPVILASDLHLAPARPELEGAFHRFCAGPGRAAVAVYLLGDLFDAWVGDEQLREPIAARVARSLADLVGAGTAVGLMHGNRDFLLGDRFAQTARVRLLPDELVVDLFGTPTLLLHGDTLCTDDAAYQRYRRVVHDPSTQRRFLALPYALRRGIVTWMRRRSRREVAGKAAMLMDVNAEAVKAALARHDVVRLIHGHTHRPARHALDVAGRPCERWVLPDWVDRPVYVEVTPAGARWITDD